MVSWSDWLASCPASNQDNSELLGKKNFWKRQGGLKNCITGNWCNELSYMFRNLDSCTLAVVSIPCPAKTQAFSCPVFLLGGLCFAEPVVGDIIGYWNILTVT